ncbi:hypothetical protein AB0M35_26505 [Micromonospora sp. NPDC051196]|uniref:hypothetical protein n=1 Tax=Micromonospora sp. NPDC051196 TaxID=3155281 RepID=UPI00342FCCF9
MGTASWTDRTARLWAGSAIAVPFPLLTFTGQPERSVAERSSVTIGDAHKIDFWRLVTRSLTTSLDGVGRWTIQD